MNLAHTRCLEVTAWRGCAADRRSLEEVGMKAIDVLGDEHAFLTVKDHVLLKLQ